LNLLVDSSTSQLKIENPSSPMSNSSDTSNPNDAFADLAYADLPESEQLKRLEAYADGFNRSETLGLFGVRIEFPDTRRVRAVIDDVRPGHRGGLGSEAINGGVLAALFDLTIGVCGALVDPSRRSATIQLSMNFERPVTGNRITAEASLDRAGGANLFASSVIYDEAGQACARGQGVVRISRSGWANGGSPAVN
jgi:uncharacterized protein (TIGR00369 family)